MVAEDRKQRYEIHDYRNISFIRATQGHSLGHVADEELLTPLRAETRDLPTVCVHGTYEHHMPSIRRRGLIPGGGRSGRRHVRFAAVHAGDSRAISGMRSNSEVAIYVDIRTALASGIRFFRSANEVLLTPDVVPPHLFSSVLRL